MHPKIKKPALTLVLLIALFGLVACSSTRTQNGVTIEKNRNYNPLSYLPGL